MVIFSLGGLTLQRRLRGGALRCRTAFLPLDGPPEVIVDGNSDWRSVIRPAKFEARADHNI